MNKPATAIFSGRSSATTSPIICPGFADRALILFTATAIASSCCSAFFPANAERPSRNWILPMSIRQVSLRFSPTWRRNGRIGVPTRNVRLSAIHAFFHFVASRNPEHLELAQRILGIPFKRAQQRVIDYLEYEEIDSILKAIDRTTAQGARDYALLATMFNTGARVQEIADLRVRDFQLDQTVPGEAVR